MKYFTKEWYELMQKLDYTSAFQTLPDKIYSEQEIQAFYDADLAEEAAHDEELYNTPPDYSLYEEWLDPDTFQPDMFLFVNEETGDEFHLETLEMAKQYIAQERAEREEAFANRPPFDPAETIKCFEQCYKGKICYGNDVYPQWLRDTVDERLLALNRITESAYKRLKIEESENQKAFDKIMREAEKELDAQEIPERIKSQLCFHDACLLSLKKNKADMELCLRKDGGWPDGTPYIKIIFKNVSKFEREKGFSLRIKKDMDGELSSSCYYLYDELYRTENGYELQLLLSTPKALRYMTISCEDIFFIDNLALTYNKEIYSKKN